VSDADRKQLEAEIEALRAENAQQASEIERLSRKITELEQRLNQGSKNSSLPPSSDSPKQQAEATKTRSDRRAAAKAKRKDEVERRRGKQPGEPGQNLAMKAVPDKVVTHEPTNCSSCGEDLSEAGEEGIERRQVFDTPDLILVSTEHRSVKKRCSCGQLNAGAQAGVLSEFTGVMVHDRLAMYFKYKKATHAICLAHVLRELKSIGVGWDQGWAKDMTALLTEMNTAAHDAPARAPLHCPQRSSMPFSPATTRSSSKASWPTPPRSTVSATISNERPTTSSPP
jgi:hypothetical protein